MFSKCSMLGSGFDDDWMSPSREGTLLMKSSWAFTALRLVDRSACSGESCK